jgi:hypothetical protein
MTDLTAITTPYGLLNEATQKALREHGGPYELWSHRSGWFTAPPIVRFDAPEMVYRVKPTPPQPREWWLRDNKMLGEWTVYDMSYFETPPVDAIHVREVIND